MRKRSLTPTVETDRASADWLDIERAAIVEVTSEEDGFPVAAALVLCETQGWRAAQSGTQSFDWYSTNPKRNCAPLVTEAGVMFATFTSKVERRDSVPQQITVVR
jgi:hypothetical protein